MADKLCLLPLHPKTQLNPPAAAEKSTPTPILAQLPPKINKQELLLNFSL